MSDVKKSCRACCYFLLSLYRTRRIVLGPQPNSPLIAHGHRNFPDGRRGDAVLRNIHFLTRSPASKADVTNKYYRLLKVNILCGHVFSSVLHSPILFQSLLDICGAHGAHSKSHSGRRHLVQFLILSHDICKSKMLHAFQK